MNDSEAAARMAQVDPACLDLLDTFVISCMGHRYHQSEAQTRAAINMDADMAFSYRRKVRRAALSLMAAGFDLRAAPASPSKPKTS